MTEISKLQEIANILRRDSATATTAAGSGHPTTCFSCAEIMSVLFFNEMSYDTENPNNPDNDEFILSKGHAAPILYSALFRANCINHKLTTLRKITSPLEGHPMPRSLPWIKVATGSLGQGLSVGVGMALAAKLSQRKYKTFVLLGDSELAEGSNYEAFQLAEHYKLDNLIAIADINRLGQTGETMLGHNLKEYKRRFESFGWNAIIVNGHDIKQILKALKQKSNKPTILIAKTYKGNPVSFLKNKENWHGKALSQIELEKAFKEIPYSKMPEVKIKTPKEIKVKVKKSKIKNNNYEIGKEIATREAYGKALASLAKSNSNILAVDAEVSNSTHSSEVKKETPKQFIETFIGEQNMIGTTLGLSKKGFYPFASTFSAFFTRAHDQLRMAALSSANFTICGSHSGISIGEDGASQMGLEDIALFRSLPESTVLYPSDAVSTEKLTQQTVNLNGIKYIRTSRPKTKVIYKNDETFPIGDFKVLKQSSKDKVILIGAGITLHEALKANKELKIPTAVIDLYCIKPFNTKKLINFIQKHGNKIVIAEDHYKAGGIGEMLTSELKNTNIKISHLYVKQIPHSGTKDQLLDEYEISSKQIESEALKII